jgi:hypothetical protein
LSGSITGFDSFLSGTGPLHGRFGLRGVLVFPLPLSVKVRGKTRTFQVFLSRKPESGFSRRSARERQKRLMPFLYQVRQA